MFDQTLPPGYFECWVADAATFFQYDAPALQPWTFTRASTGQIPQPILNLRGVNTQLYFCECFDTIQAWFPQAENFVLPKAPHTMLQNNPQGTAERLVSFWAKHRLSAG